MRLIFKTGTIFLCFLIGTGCILSAFFSVFMAAMLSTIRANSIFDGLAEIAEQENCGGQHDQANYDVFQHVSPPYFRVQTRFDKL